jgi:hypothetical protein
VKRVAVLLVSLIVIGLILWYCLLPPRRMPDYAIGDEKCDLCGEPSVYRLWIEDHYLAGEYCRTHRWIGVINSDPINKLMNVLLGAAVFGAITSALSLLSRVNRRPDRGLETGDQGEQSSFRRPPEDRPPGRSDH